MDIIDKWLKINIGLFSEIKKYTCAVGNLRKGATILPR